MIVAIIYEGDVDVNEYLELKDIEELKDNFLPETVLIELTERPEEREGYRLRHDGIDFYYEKVEESETVKPEPSQLDRIESVLNELTSGSVSTSAVDEAITEGVNDV